MEGHPTREEIIFGFKPLNFGSQTAALFIITSQAHKPEHSVQSLGRSCYSSHPY
jgi:hypothetical protein